MTMSASLRISGFLATVFALVLAVSTADAQTAAPAAPPPARIGVVDTQRAIMETEDGLRAQATLKKLFDSRQRELDKKQEDLQKERDDIDKQKAVLSQAALAKHLAIGVARFNQRIGVAEQAVAGLQLDIKVLVV